MGDVILLMGTVDASYYSFIRNNRCMIYIYCILEREIWKIIHPRVSYSLRATPEGNMILVG